MLDARDILGVEKTLSHGENYSVRKELTEDELSALVMQLWGGKPITLDGETPKIIMDLKGADGRIKDGGNVLVKMTGIPLPENSEFR